MVRSYTKSSAKADAALKILAFDTATTMCSAAVWADGAVRSQCETAMERGHAGALMPMVLAVMRAADLSFGDIDVFAVTVGPGSYTGVRIGLAAARGLHLAAGKPLIGVTTLAAVAWGAADEAAGRVIAVALDTKRADLYAQIFDAGLTAHLPALAALPAAVAMSLPPAPVLVVGDGAARLMAVLPAGTDAALANAPGWPSAGTVAAIAARRIATDPAALTAPPPRPLYLRSAHVTLQKHGGRVRP